MKTLIKILLGLFAVIGVIMLALRSVDSSSRKQDDRLHIAQLKGKLPFGRFSKKRSLYDGEEVVAKKIADYRDEEDEEDTAEDAQEASAVTARLPRKVKLADPAEQKRISRLRRAAGAAEDAEGVSGGDGNADGGDSFNISEDELEELFDE